MRVLRRRWTAALLAAGLALLAGCSSVGPPGPAAGGGDGAAPVDTAGSEMATAPAILRPDANGEIRLVAKPARLEVAPGVEKEVWAYNGSVPGPEIRVKQGPQ
ncbi:hypothetical protein [Thermaerobacter sp. PB12/4term]|uniref:hypothetical protein n=1 Tax=Thermaerobacter sp. PB12/4term TaxID=2293838 RepID=UPI001FABCAA2|nr:hypothetical protein [Thermaerobacter sp. PB12/4term]